LGDQAYQGQTDAIRSVAPRARDCTNRRYRFGQRVDEAIKAKNRNKSRVRAKVEHSIGVIKRVFGFQKVRYRGLAKNLHRLEVTAALANLFMVRRRLLADRGGVGESRPRGPKMTQGRSKRGETRVLATLVAPLSAALSASDVIFAGCSEVP